MPIYLRLAIIAPTDYPSRTVHSITTATRQQSLWASFMGHTVVALTNFNLVHARTKLDSARMACHTKSSNLQQKAN